MYDAGDTKCVCVTRTRCDARAAYSRASEQRNLGALLELALARNALERRHRRVDLRVRVVRGPGYLGKPADQRSHTSTSQRERDQQGRCDERGERRAAAAARFVWR